jgi:hypothetical protein
VVWVCKTVCPEAEADRDCDGHGHAHGHGNGGGHGNGNGNGNGGGEGGAHITVWTAANALRGSASETWVCSVCTLVNHKALAPVCVVCCSRRPS